METDGGMATPDGLSMEQVNQVRALATASEARDGYSMEARLNLGTLETRPEGSVSDVLWHESGRLVGFAGMRSRGDPSEVEATFLVHPEFRRKGVGRRMVRVVVRECQKHEVKRLLIVVPRQSREGTAFAATMGTLHSRSEYTMDLDVKRISLLEGIHDPVELRPAGAADVPVMAAIAASAFAEPVHEEEQALVRLMKDPARMTYLATQDGRPVGVIQSAVSDGHAFIVHFAVRQTCKDGHRAADAAGYRPRPAQRRQPVDHYRGRDRQPERIVTMRAVWVRGGWHDRLRTAGAAESPYSP